MTVGVVGIRRTARDGDADQGHDIRGRVGERVKPIGEDGDRAGVITERHLRNGNEEIENKYAVEDPRDFGVAISHM